MSTRESFRILVPSDEDFKAALNEGIGEILGVLSGQIPPAQSKIPALVEFSDLSRFNFLNIRQENVDGQGVLSTRVPMGDGGMIAALAIRHALKETDSDRVITFNAIDIDNSESRVFGVTKSDMTVIDSEMIASSLRRNFETARENESGMAL